jgi:hypothetical protein
VWSDHGALKTILLGVWRVAASSLAGISAAARDRRHRRIMPTRTYLSLVRQRNHQSATDLSRIGTTRMTKTSSALQPKLDAFIT